MQRPYLDLPVMSDPGAADAWTRHLPVLPHATSSVASRSHLAVLTTHLGFKESVSGLLLFPHKLFFPDLMSHRGKEACGKILSLRDLLLYHGSFQPWDFESITVTC